MPTTPRFKSRARALLPSLDQLPRKPRLLKVQCEEAERPAQRRRLLVQNGPICLAEEDNVEERHANRVEQEADYGKSPRVGVLRRVTLHTKVGTQETLAMIKHFAREGLEGGGAHHWED